MTKSAPAEPHCAACGILMARGELRVPRARAICRVGSPPPPERVLPIWRCGTCGRRQPRIDP